MLSPDSQKTSCTDKMRKRFLVKSRAIRREYCARRRKDVDIIDILKEDEFNLRELIRATKDVLMLRLAKIRTETAITPTFNNRLGSYKDHAKIFR